MENNLKNPLSYFIKEGLVAMVYWIPDFTRETNEYEYKIQSVAMAEIGCEIISGLKILHMPSGLPDKHGLGRQIDAAYVINGELLENYGTKVNNEEEALEFLKEFSTQIVESNRFMKTEGSILIAEAATLFND